MGTSNVSSEQNPSRFFQQLNKFQAKASLWLEIRFLEEIFSNPKIIYFWEVATLHVILLRFPLWLSFSISTLLHYGNVFWILKTSSNSNLFQVWDSLEIWKDGRTNECVGPFFPPLSEQLHFFHTISGFSRFLRRLPLFWDVRIFVYFAIFNLHWN